MPRMGTPDSSSPAGAGGAPGAYTEAGPPDRMIADGFLASISAAGMVEGTISEYTWHSRTRRAMSWAYWAPKSTTRTGPVLSARSDGLVTALLSVTSEWYTASAYLGRGLAPRRLSWRRRRLGDPDLGDPAAVQLGHGQPAPVELGRLPGLRQVTECGHEVAGHRLVRAVRQLDPGLLSEVVQVHQPVDLDLACAQATRWVGLRIVFILDVAD